LPNKHEAILQEFADRVSALVEASKATGRISEDMADLIDSHPPDDLRILYRKLFKTEPTEE